ncbi:MAG: M24 family metallopeptidase [Eubacteriaceae bacterium]|jgi:Xaa-Pro aminopeptidase|nr:M24 family metallopeptidase [Eubacteriaceae bacterium]
MSLSPSFYKNNRQNLAEKLEKGCAVILYSGREISQSLDAVYPFFYDNNFYYLTGLTESEMILLMVKDQEGKVSEKLYLEENDPLTVKWVGAKMEPEEASAVSAIQEVAYLPEFTEDLCSLENIEIYYFDRTPPKHQSLALEEESADHLRNKSAKDVGPLIADMRLYKQKEEIDALQQAIDITQVALETLLKNLKPDKKEFEMAALFEYSVRLAGAEGLAFPTIAVSGKHATVLHYIQNNATMAENTLLLLDLGARYDGYCADISRTYPVDGRYTGVRKTAYEVVLEVQKEMIQSYQPGAEMKELQNKTRELFSEKCFSAGLIPKDHDIEDCYYHGIGHSLGLDVHDTKDKRDYTLTPGMVLTCEPGIYIQEHGIGIRIEDDILITEEGPVNLSKNIVKEIEEIEAFMS